MQTRNDDGRVLSARQRRALERAMRSIAAWHDALPQDRRRPFYPGQEIADGARLDPGQAGPALRALGWQHAQRRLAERDGLPVSVWAPPGAPHPRRPVGRPAARAGHVDDLLTWGAL